MTRSPVTSPDGPEAAREPKNLKIDAQVHRRLKVEAATRGVSLQILTETALLVGLAGLAHTLNYREQIGSIEASPVKGHLHGKLLFASGLVTYEGETLRELETAFHVAVDHYLSRQPTTGTTS